MSKGSSPSIPKPPSLGKSYGQGVNLNLQYLPQQIGAEDQLRGQTDAQRIQAQQGLQARFGPTQYSQQRQALDQIDPQWFNTHGALYNNVMQGLNYGTQLDPASANQLQQEVRGAQAARGNIYGDSAAIQEAYTLGDRGQQLYQQRLQNAAGFLGMPGVAAQTNLVSPVSPDRSFAYVDPASGFQGINAANARYQGMVGAAAGNQNSGGGWSSTLGDAFKLYGSLSGTGII